MTNNEDRKNDTGFMLMELVYMILIGLLAFALAPTVLSFVLSFQR